MMVQQIKTFLKRSLPLIFTLAAIPAFSQEQPDPEALKAKYNGVMAVNLELVEDLLFEVVKNELKVTRRTYEKKIYLTDKVPASLYSSITHSSFYKITDIEARTIVPKGNGKYKSVKVGYFSESNARSQGIFYDDLQSVNFFYPEVEEGAITEVDYTMNIAEPRLLSAAYLQSYYPTESKVVTVTFPAEVKLSVKLMNTDHLNIEYTETKSGKNTVYKWVVKEAPKMEFESDGPDPRYYMPMIHVVLNEVQFPLGTKRYLGDETDLHKWYRDLIVGYDDEGKNDKEIKELVDSITNGLTTDREKVRAIYYWVQDNIKYIAFEDNLSGFIPRPPAKVCSRRFGDCKDMASIIKEMCAQAGVEAYLTWIGTRDIPYRYADVPTASSDNHMIATWFDENETPVFLDGTARYMEFGVAPYHIQGKEALVSFSEKEFKVIEVPFADKSYSRIIDTSWLEVSGTDIVASAKHIQTGYTRNYTTYYMNGQNDDERIEYLKAALQKGNNKFKLTENSVSNLDTIEKDLVVDYKYMIPDYVTGLNNQLYIDLNLFDELGKKIKKDREVPVEYPFKESRNYVFILEIPEGYEVEHLPANVTESMEGYSVAIKYTVEKGKIIYNLDVAMEYSIMGKELFDAWNELYAKINRALSENIVLKKI